MCFDVGGKLTFSVGQLVFNWQIGPFLGNTDFNVLQGQFCYCLGFSDGFQVPFAIEIEIDIPDLPSLSDYTHLV